MSQVFRLKEILDLAVKKEQEAAALYKKLAEQANNPEMKKMFETLVSQEHGHETFYKNLSEQIKEERSPGPKDEHEYSGFMKQMIEESRTAKAPSNLSDMKSVLDYAIARENDSVRFYTELKSLVSSTAHSKIDYIIAEEKKHAEILSKMKANLV